MFEGLTKLTEELDAVQKKMREAGEGALREALKEFFAAFPDVKAIRWRQYTPYFNDGDPCVFRVSDLYVDIGGEEDGGDYEDGFTRAWSLREKNAALADAIGILGGAMSNMEDAMKAAFGDHARITATPEAITVEEYDHD